MKKKSLLLIALLATSSIPSIQAKSRTKKMVEIGAGVIATAACAYLAYEEIRTNCNNCFWRYNYLRGEYVSQFNLSNLSIKSLAFAIMAAQSAYESFMYTKEKAETLQSNPK